jgi:hypothetical protein
MTAAMEAESFRRKVHGANLEAKKATSSYFIPDAVRLVPGGPFFNHPSKISRRVQSTPGVASKPYFEKCRPDQGESICSNYPGCPISFAML